jgi:hypothetical protein
MAECANILRAANELLKSLPLLKLKKCVMMSAYCTDGISTLSPPQQCFVLIKPALLSTQHGHFAGGKHVVLCMATTLAALGHEVRWTALGEGA